MNQATITAGLGMLAALAVELLPGLKERWAALSANTKVAARGWGALIFALLYVSITQGLPALQSPAALLHIGQAWVTFVIGAEGAYQLTAFQLPRKRS